MVRRVRGQRIMGCADWGDGMNLEAELAANMRVFSDFAKTRAAVNYPAKMDVPLVWDLYMDTARPVGQTQDTASLTESGGQSAPAAPLEAVRQADYAPQPIAYRLQPDSYAPQPAVYRLQPDSYAPQPIAYTSAEPLSAPAAASYYEAADGDTELLGLVNDRLRTQARRYPHPITNEMEAIH